LTVFPLLIPVTIPCVRPYCFALARCARLRSGKVLASGPFGIAQGKLRPPLRVHTSPNKKGATWRARLLDR
jgi:hypothetical protein